MSDAELFVLVILGSVRSVLVFCTVLCNIVTCAQWVSEQY